MPAHAIIFSLGREGLSQNACRVDTSGFEGHAAVYVYIII